MLLLNEVKSVVTECCFHLEMISFSVFVALFGACLSGKVAYVVDINMNIHIWLNCLQVCS